MEDLEKIERQFDTKELEQYSRDLEVMSQYDKEDRVISSVEAQELAEADRKIPSIKTNIDEIDNLLGGLRA